MMTPFRTHWRVSSVFLLLALLALLAIYLPTLQTIPNGSEHYYMIDVGETQIVLNVWGTLHATGYPLYILLSAALTALLRAFGAAAVTAPALTSLIWGLAALTLLYSLLTRRGSRPILAAGTVILIGLTRTVWIHHVIAEIYTFGLLLMMALLAVALWTPPVRHRLYWLALLGGVAVAHHRAAAMMIPALLFAVYPDLWAERKRLPLILLACLALGLIGFAQYIYLPLRAQAGAAWVYGEPETLSGLWDQFIGTEASRFIGAPGTLEGLLANVRQINEVLITDLTLPGIVIGAIGLLWGLRAAKWRHLSVVMLLNGGAALVFHYLFYTDILSALILPVLISIGVGWLLLAEQCLDWAAQRKSAALNPLSVTSAGLLAAGALLAFALIQSHRSFIASLVTDMTGVQTIEMAAQAPPDSTLMLAWGPRHFAVGFAHDVEGQLSSLRLVDHKADFGTLITQGPLVTPSYTFYRFSPPWWSEQIGQAVYLRAVAPDLIEIAAAPELGTGDTLEAQSVTVTCSASQIILRLAWFTPTQPQQDQSVFVHLLDSAGVLIAQADQQAPVYGWRPMTTWQDNEIVRDVYALPRLPDAAQIRYGLYTQTSDGAFLNSLESSLAVECDV